MLMAEDFLLLSRNSVDSLVPEMNVIHLWCLVLLALFLPIFFISSGRNSHARKVNKDCLCESTIFFLRKIIPIFDKENSARPPDFVS